MFFCAPFIRSVPTPVSPPSPQPMEFDLVVVAFVQCPFFLCPPYVGMRCNRQLLFPKMLATGKFKHNKQIALPKNSKYLLWPPMAVTAKATFLCFLSLPSFVCCECFCSCRTLQADVTYSIIMGNDMSNANYLRWSNHRWVIFFYFIYCKYLLVVDQSLRFAHFLVKEFWTYFVHAAHFPRTMWRINERKKCIKM